MHALKEDLFLTSSVKVCRAEALCRVSTDPPGSAPLAASCTPPVNLGLPVCIPYYANTTLTLPAHPLNHASVCSTGWYRLSNQEKEPQKTLRK